MIGAPPPELDPIDPMQRTYPRSYRDAAVRAASDAVTGEVTCALCGSVARSLREKNSLHADHRIAHSRGGLTSWENLQLLCPGCNLRKGAK
jgi:5-methylcytosine-specific restriction endonuclease McrA